MQRFKPTLYVSSLVQNQLTEENEKVLQIEVHDPSFQTNASKKSKLQSIRKTNTVANSTSTESRRQGPITKARNQTLSKTPEKPLKVSISVSCVDDGLPKATESPYTSYCHEEPKNDVIRVKLPPENDKSKSPKLSFKRQQNRQPKTRILHSKQEFEKQEEPMFFPRLSKHSLAIASAARLKKLKVQETEESHNKGDDLNTSNFSSTVNKLPTDFRFKSNFQKEAFRDETPEKECSFRPKINKRSAAIDGRRNGSLNVSREEILNSRMTQQQERLNNTKVKVQEEQEKAMQKECTFRPKINNSKQEDISRSEGSVVDRLMFWHRKQQEKIGNLVRQKEAVEEESTILAQKLPQSYLPQEDLSIVSAPSVSKSIAQFLMRNEQAHRMKKEKLELMDKYKSLRPSLKDSSFGNFL